MALKKVNEILNNDRFKENVKKLEEIERDREFCRHDIEHFLDVSRIAYIINLEEDFGIPKEVVYGVGLLHDLGRVLEHEKGISFREGSIILAKLILDETSYTKKEKNDILKAIGEQRQECSNTLSRLIYKSNKLSRNCFNCKVEDRCGWLKKNKNFKIKY